MILCATFGTAPDFIRSHFHNQQTKHKIYICQHASSRRVHFLFFVSTVLRHDVRYAGVVYSLLETYGLQDMSPSNQNTASKECVICLTEPINTRSLF